MGERLAPRPTRAQPSRLVLTSSAHKSDSHLGGSSGKEGGHSGIPGWSFGVQKASDP